MSGIGVAIGIGFVRRIIDRILYLISKEDKKTVLITEDEKYFLILENYG